MGDVMKEYHDGQTGFETFGSGSGGEYPTERGEAHDGSPRNGASNHPFGYQVASMENGLPAGPSASQGNILDGNDESRMANFFDHLQDPHDSHALTHNGNEHTGLEDFGGLPFGDNFAQNYTFDNINGTINPAATLAGLPTSNVQTHLGTPSFAFHGQLPFSFNDLSENFHPDVPRDVDAGAQLLADLANGASGSSAQNTHSQNHTSAWVQLGNGHQFTSTTQHDSEGAAGLLQTLASQAVMQIGDYTNLQAQSPSQGQHMQHNVNGHNGFPHVRSSSAHEVYAASGLVFGQQNTQSASPAVRPPSRMPTTVSFGTDPRFSQGRNYQTTEYEALQRDKIGNLMQVPLADRAAAPNSQAHSPSAHMSPHEQRTAHMNSMGGFRNPFADGNRNTNNIMGPPSRPGTAQWGTMTNGGIAAHSANTNGFLGNDAQSRKRRKSQMEREDEDEYIPEGQRTRGTIPTRGPKVPKGGLLHHASYDEDEEDDDDFDEDAYVLASARKAAPKRRKSVANPRPADASPPHTPINSHSPAGAVDNAAIKPRRPSGRSRANLTEEQKRQNHILSEQKRRVVIKQGYEQLEKLVPSLKNGKSGLSKAEQIKEIAAYVSEVVKGNKRMKKMLQQMDEQVEEQREQRRALERQQFGNPYDGYRGHGTYEEDDDDAGAGAGAVAGPSNAQGLYGGYSGYPPPQM